MNESPADTVAQPRSLINPNLMRLVFCQLVSVSGTVMLVTLGGILGGALAGDPRWATLPVSLMVVGTALGTVPAALMMQRIGRRLGFVAGLAMSGSGMMIASVALLFEDFWLFCVATFVLGASLAVSQQYRFAAAECVTADRVSQAVSVVLIGSIGGALIGPELVKFSDGSLAGFTTPMWIAVGMYVLAILVALGYQGQATAGLDVAAPSSSAFSRLRGDRFFLAAVCGGVVAQGVMTLVMTATPISMHVVDGFSLADTANVIRNHVLAMYVPSLFSGWLMAQFGVGRVMYAGVAIFLATVAVGLMGHEYMHYSLSMIALGVGWNFLFVGGTTLLVRAQTGSERFSAQALNDFCVFGGSAVASLAAGMVLHSIGWEPLLMMVVPIVLLVLVLLLSVRRDERFA